MTADDATAKPPAPGKIRVVEIIRLALDAAQFDRLVGGDMVEIELDRHHTLRLILSDIGYGRMIAGIERAIGRGRTAL